MREDRWLRDTMTRRNVLCVVRATPLQDFSETRSLRGVRLGIFWDYFNDAEVPILQSCRKAVEALEALGAEVVPIAIPHLRSLQVRGASGGTSPAVIQMCSSI